MITPTETAVRATTPPRVAPDTLPASCRSAADTRIHARRLHVGEEVVPGAGVAGVVRSARSWAVGLRCPRLERRRTVLRQCSRRNGGPPSTESHVPPSTGATPSKAATPTSSADGTTEAEDRATGRRPRRRPEPAARIQFRSVSAPTSGSAAICSTADAYSATASVSNPAQQCFTTTIRPSLGPRDPLSQVPGIRGEGPACPSGRSVRRTGPPRPCPSSCALQ